MSSITMKVEDIFDDSEIVHQEITSQSRWMTYHAIVIKVDGKFYAWNYGNGSTENQEDDYNWDDEVELTEVFPKEVVKTIYVTKEKLNAVQ